MTGFLSRRHFLVGAATAAILTQARVRQASASPSPLTFDELYGSFSALGLTFSDKVKALADQPVAMQGFMAPPLKAESNFFVLTEIPMALCPFCSTDADWPDNIVVVYLEKTQTFEQANALIEVRGRLEVGSWTDPETGFLSRLRIVDATFGRA
ncbi:hypothetical protein [Consotaella salsifontis]|uniref:Uncharacterized protein n=1 Tax=Consotaella salsifontis TaxID=1365950 RepID=A0A1T4RRC7_9HYPH|nr:hypothetical protein [Consotaella salsifontis]SKA18575.1 hypothetical protein SAMN05428963_107210 [Consotaella salsifontis]